MGDVVGFGVLLLAVWGAAFLGTVSAFAAMNRSARRKALAVEPPRPGDGPVIVGDQGRARPPVDQRTARSDLRIGRHDSWS